MKEESMARAPFCIVEQKTEKGRVFVARFVNEKGRVIKTKTFSSARSRTQAARQAEALLREGIIANDSNPDALEYLRTFWTRESDYVRSRALRGVVLSEHYLYITRSVLNKHLAPKIKSKKLLDLDADFVESLVLELSSKGVQPRTINAVIASMRVPMKYFCRRHRVANPIGEVEHLAEHPKERGTLSIAELQKIVALNESPRAKAGVLLAALCGLRLGECLGLMAEDIDREKSMMTIRHNFVDDELKGPKGSRPGAQRIRQVPIPRPVLEAIELCEACAPRGARHIIWGERDPKRPADRKTLQDGYFRMLHAIGIDEAERKQRNLVFHGLRHTFISLQRASGIPDFVVQRMAGHRSIEMTERYSHAENVVDFNAAREALEKVVENNPVLSTTN
jgi:integrase